MSVSTAAAAVTNTPAESCVMAQRGAVLAGRIFEWAYASHVPSHEQVAVVINDSQVLFDLRGPRRCIVSVRLIEGRYPLNQKLLPQIDRPYQRMEVGVDQLVSVLRQAAIVPGPENIAVQLALSPADCRVTAQTPEVGTAIVESKFSNVTDPVSVKLDFTPFAGGGPMYPTENDDLVLGQERHKYRVHAAEFVSVHLDANRLDCGE